MRARCAALALLAALAVCGSAAADRPVEPAEVDGPHIAVHYDPATESASAASALLAEAESAWSTEVAGWGFDPPPNDGDGRTDIYVEHLADPGEGGVAETDDGADNGAGFITLDLGATRPAFLAHELMHLIQFGYLVGDRPFMYEATAEWAAANVAPVAADLTTPLFLTHPESPLDCDPGCAGGDVGYGQWPFFEYVSERFGASTVRHMWEALAEDDAEGSQALPSIEAALTAAGSSLTAVWNAYASQNLAPAAYANPILHALGTRRPAAQPLRSGSTVTVEHLAARYLSLTAACGKKAKARALRLQVSVPAGSGAAPAVGVAPKGGATKVTSMPVQGGTASASVRLAPCATAIVALPNPSPDGTASFRVQASLR